MAVTARAQRPIPVSLRPLAVDGSLAVVLLVITIIQIAADGLDDGSARFLMLAPGVTLPLSCRRIAPFATVVVVAGALTAQSLVTAPLPAFGEFLAVMLATYSVAAHTATQTAVLGMLCAGTAVAAQGVRDPAATSSFEFVYGIVYFGGAWLLGRVVRRRRMHIRSLEAETERLKFEREEKARAAVAEERRRIARELHDVVAHCMSVIVVQAGAAEEVLDRDPAGTRDALRSIRAAGNDALAEMRRLLGVLREE